MTDKQEGLFTYGAFFLLGAAVGAAAGVLFAPDSGPETRRKMGRWLDAKRRDGRVEYDAVKDAVAAGRKAFADKHKEAVGT